MLELFTRLTLMLEVSALFAMVAAFVWGVLSVVLSPCHLAGIPLIMGHIVTQSDGTKKKAGVMALLFALGILVTLLVIGIITSLLGRLAGDAGPVVTYIVGGFLLFFGIYLTGFLPFDLFNFSVQPGIKKRGLFPSFLFGLIFGLALGPCTFAFMAPMLAVGFQSARTSLLFAFSLFSLFALGHCAVIVAAGILTETVRSLLKWNEQTGVMDIVKKIFGFLIAGTGIYLILQQIFGW
jgi:cytochrome c-type biogenesis protein